LNVIRVAENTESGQEPNDDANHHDNVEDLLDLPVHGNVGINQPEQHANYD
jgi:hypothetical protein